MPWGLIPFTIDRGGTTVLWSSWKRARTEMGRGSRFIVSPNIVHRRCETITPNETVPGVKMSPSDASPLDLRDYLSILWARRWIVLAIVATTTTAALLYSYRQTPVYTSSAEVVVFAARFDPNQPSAAPGIININTEQQVANSMPVAQLASKHLAALGLHPGSMSVTSIAETEALVFTASSSNPASAQATADAYASAYLELRRDTVLSELEDVRRPYETRIAEIDKEARELAQTIPTISDESQKGILTTRYAALLGERATLVQELNSFVSPDNVRVGNVVQSAPFPPSPTSPNHVKDGSLGLIVGLALGIGMAFFRDRLDERVRGRQELELHSGAPVLAFIPHVPRMNGSLITVRHPASEAAEAYRALRVRLMQASARHRFKTVLVTSSLPGEGKTSTVANLGVALAQEDRRVVLLSADLRRPRLQMYFPAGKTGVADVLSGKRTALEALSSTQTKHLWVLHAGDDLAAGSPLQLLDSAAMEKLLVTLRDFADIVLIDSPPLLTSPDVAALVPLTDGVLFVADPSRVERSMVEAARHEFEVLGAPIIGVVVNNYDPRRFRTYGSGYYAYSYRGQRNGSSQAAAPTSIVPAGQPLKPAEPPFEGRQPDG
jgi:capsular exopolysaccharide synthesis family protein